MDLVKLSGDLKRYIRFANLKFTENQTEGKPSTSNYSYKYNSEFLTRREQDNIYGLFLFMRCNINISDTQLQSIINDEANQFTTLQALTKEVHGLIPDLRLFGYNSVCNSIIKNRKLKKSSHSVQL